MPAFSLARIIYSVKDPVALSTWYISTFGWKIAVDERADKWIELDTGGGVMLALHGGAKPASGYWPKLQIRVADVAKASAELTAKGVAMGKITTWKKLEWAEGKDPEGNTFQVSNR